MEEGVLKLSKESGKILILKSYFGFYVFFILCSNPFTKIRKENYTFFCSQKLILNLPTPLNNEGEITTCYTERRKPREKEGKWGGGSGSNSNDNKKAWYSFSFRFMTLTTSVMEVIL
jgi:hypothetical protein